MAQATLARRSIWIAEGTIVPGSMDEVLGGKARNLGILTAGRLPVPSWYCVTSRVSEDIVDRAGPDFATTLKRASAESDRDVLERASMELTCRFTAAGLSPDQGKCILEAFDRRFGPDGSVAVRSSAIGEDSACSSFAGQMDSFLFVGRDALLKQVLACLASAFSPRCLLYRRLKANANRHLGSAVVVQQMVASAASGVLFTMNPVSGVDDEMVVSAAFGLGEGVVQERAEVDTYVLDRSRSVVLRRSVPRKNSQVLAAGGGSGGTRVASVPEERAMKSVLDDRRLFQLQALARKIEKLFGAPQDVEWALDGQGRFHITQSRPITAMGARRPLTRVFDNSNIAENFHGVTTPLTYSYVRQYYENVFTLVARSFGTKEREIARHRDEFANLVSFLAGSIYYNLNNWYRIFFVIPGFEYWIRPFEEGVGLPGTPAELDEECRRRKASSPALKRGMAWCRIVVNLLLLPIMMRRFDRRFQAFRDVFSRVDLERLPSDALLDHYHSIQTELASQWGTPLLNDYYVFIFFSLINRLARRWALDPTGSLRSELLSGNLKLASVEPIQSLLELARRLKESPKLVALLETNAGNAWKAIDSEPAWAGFRKALLTHIDEFGDRTFDELKLEAPRLQDNPEQLLVLLKSYLRCDLSAAQKSHGDGYAVRREAQKRVARALRWHPLRRSVFAVLVKLAHVTIGYREYGRLARSRRCGMERSILLAIGRRLAEDAILATPDDIYFLTVEEITSYICGSSTTRSLADLAAIRRREFQDHQQHSLRGRVITKGIVYRDLASGSAALDVWAVPAGGRLRGIGCSPGRARGRARVVFDPVNDSLLPGDILVAKATEPAWAFLMAAADGLVVERGNMLSHAAIIGRELRIPTVIGVDGVTQLVADGQMVEIDGTEGTVTLVEEQPSGGATRMTGVAVGSSGALRMGSS
jgi:rifampicin phosphotransferase